MSEPNQDLVERMQGDECFRCHQIGHWSCYCPLKSPNNKPNLMKRMQGDECFLCHQIGHWSWYCPLKSPSNKPDLVKRMRGDECFSCHQIGHWSWYCPLKSPNNKLVKRMRGDECFLCHQIGHWSWYCPSKSPNNKPFSLSPKNHSPLSRKMILCHCGHGFCKVKISLNDCKNYECPIKRNHGSCGYQVSEDELLNNESIVPIQQNRDITDLGEINDLVVQMTRMRIKDNSNSTS